ncbi:uncharacterized protein LOC125677095 [Ostrea edulis]|uniref:uncharacterized protein LOC125677095 n=1 Tax=Ostrea edulis TaxID=37623 RepID=UPI0024AEFA04|nr:uncharacterized protein LOC125677095 [Ostrea edulis]
MITYLFFVILFKPDWSIAEKGGCSENTHGCCAETIWNETLGRCTGCMPGYLGQYCNETCEYPRYGMRCMKKCVCEQDTCNFVTGCPHQESSTILEHSSSIPGEGKPTEPIFKEDEYVSSTVQSNKRESILVPIISVLGSILIGVGILYAIIYLYERKKVTGPPEFSSTQTKHYEQIDEIAIHI